MNLEAIIGIIGVILSASTVAASLTGNLASRRQLKIERARLQNVHVDAVIASANLSQLGTLLTKTLGDTSVSNYVKNGEVRTNFRRAFNAARNFIGEPITTEPDDAETGQRHDGDRSYERQLDVVSSEAERAIGEIAEGESWNALARMRRDVEIALTSRLDLPPDRPRRMAASQLLAVATQRDLVPAALANSARYAISIANRAVHGEDVRADEAVEAVVMLDRLMRWLR